MRIMKSDPSRPVGRPRGFDRDAALDIALGLFWQRGYEGVSFADLTEAIGVAAPSLYAAFGDKRSLFRAAVARYEAREGGAMALALSGEGTVAAIGRMFDQAAAAYTRRSANSGQGCMVLTALLGCSEELQDLAGLVRERREASDAAIRTRLERGIAEGDLAASTDVVSLARFLSAVLRGMAIQARDGATENDLREVARVALQALRDAQVGRDIPLARNEPSGAAPGA